MTETPTDPDYVAKWADALDGLARRSPDERVVLTTHGAQDVARLLRSLQRLVSVHHEPWLRGAKAGDVCPICEERGALHPETAMAAVTIRRRRGPFAVAEP